MISRENILLTILIGLLLVVYGVAYFLSYQVNGENFLYFSLSDGLIYAQYVKSMMLGSFYQYNIGEYSTGTTSFLWPYIVYFVGKILNIDATNIHIAFHLTSFILVILSSILSFKIMMRLTSNNILAFITTLVTILYFKIIWSTMSGLEINLAIFILYLSVYLFIVNRIYLFIIISSLFYMIRPEMILLNIPFILYFLFKREYKYLLMYIILIGIFLSITFTVYYHVSDKIFPSTFYSKASSFSLKAFAVNALVFIPEYLFGYSENNNSLIILLIVFLGYKFSKYNDQTKGINLLFYGILVFLFYKTILSPGLGQMNRYFIFIEPLIILLFFYSIKDIGNRKYIYIASIIISITSFASFAKVKNPYIISSMNQGAMGMSNYITTHLDNNTAIAIENAGMKYFLDNKTVDIVGLTTKELNTKENLYRKDDMSFIFNYLSTNNVEYIQFFPTWFERIYGKEPEFLTKIYELKINNPIFNVERWAIYRFNKEDYDAYISNNDGKK